MLDIGFSELVLFGVAALLILGPEKLPTAVRTAGRWYAKIRRMVSNVQRDIEQELQLSEMREHMQQELARIKNIELNMQQQIKQMHDDLAEINPKDPSVPSATAPAHTNIHYTPIHSAQLNIFKLAPMAHTTAQLARSSTKQPSHSTEPPPVVLKKTTLPIADVSTSE